MLTILTIIFITLSIFAFLTWFFVHKSKEKERLLLIEKGTDYSDLPDRDSFNFKFPWLKLGIVITSIAVGTGIGVFIMELGIDEGIVPLSMFLFGGIGMIIAHFADKPNDNS